MIPYIIKQARPTCDIRDNNVIVHYNLTRNIEDLDKDVIDFIVGEMYEFCSEKYGHNIQIKSYSDFCKKYWEILEIKLHYWENVFEVYYFKNEWIKWNLTSHQDKIFSCYMEKLLQV
jgi:hypothetical protein